MKGFSKNIKFILSLIISILLFHSCILDEFKASEITFEDDWRMDIVTPLFFGNMEFKDLIHDWDTISFQGNEPTSVLTFPNDSLVKIPTRLIFEPAVIIKEFSFLVQGNYNFSAIKRKYTVTNGSPFALNFQMRFSDKNSSAEK